MKSHLKFVLILVICLNITSAVFAVQTIYVGQSEDCKTLKAAYDSILWNPADSTVLDEVHIILTSDIKSINMPMSNEYTKMRRNEYDIFWVKRGTTSKRIYIYSDKGYKYAINRPDPDSKKSSWAMIFYRVDYLIIDSVIFNDCATGLFFSACNYCSIDNCEFYSRDFQVKSGGGMIELSGPAFTNPGDNELSKYNTISNNVFEFKDEAVLDVVWEDEDVWNPSWRWNRFDTYHAIYLAHCHGNLIFGNTFINAPGFGIHAWGDYTSGNKIYQNTFQVVYGHNYKLLSPLLNKVYADAGLKSDSAEWHVDAWRHGLGIWFRNKPATVKDNIITDNDFYTNVFSPLINYCVSDSTFELIPPSNILAMPAVLMAHSNQFRNNRYCDNWEPDFLPSKESEYLARYNARYNSGDILLLEVPFDSTCVLIVDKIRSVIYKVLRGNWQGNSMFEKYYVGSQEFEHEVTSIEFVDNFTLLGFSNGNFLKLDSTGSIGPCMFNVIEKSGGGFENYDEDNTLYLAGSYKFNSGLRNIKHIHGFTFLSFEDGKILKINGSGGEGDNVFKITESSNGFSSLPGFTHYSGHHKFMGRITNITNIKYNSDYRTYFCFDNGKILQIDKNYGTGGMGRNMFAITEDSDGFTPLDGYFFYQGHDKFSGNVHKIYFKQPYTIFCFKNQKDDFMGGKILAVSGLGNSSRNLFSVDDDSVGIIESTGSYYFGHDQYGSYVTDIVEFNNKIYISFNDGKLKKYNSLGVSGANMLDQVKDGYEKFFSTVTDLQIIDNHLLVCLMNGKILKFGELNGKLGDDRGEMFNVYERGDHFITHFSKNTYLKGSDNVHTVAFEYLK